MSSKKIPEKDADPGDVVETANGNRYLILADRRLAYLGNRDLGRSDDRLLVKTSPENPVHKVGRLVPLPETVRQDDQIKAWAALVEKKVTRFVQAKNAVEWVWNEEVASATGFPLVEEDWQLHQQAISPFKDHPTVLVEVLRSEYSNYVPYFMISLRDMPPGISLG